jgi:Glycosyl hydrolase 36 superfamily, catalytic domain/Glycosyltransferase family 36
MTTKAFGSGNFGEWIVDEFDLPAYRYTCDQVKEPRAISPTNPVWRAPTDHSHQVGNDRLVAVASNYGYIQVRQDEGGPKFLNDYDPHHNHYAGGFGYLIDGQTVLGTFYKGEADSFERIFGIGYLRKKVQKNGYTADQVIFAPFGDDPLLISQVTITNRTKEAASLRWIEYWGCQQYKFSHRAQVLATISRGKRQTADLRREFASRFAHHFRILSDWSGLINENKFLGYTTSDRSNWTIAQFLLATVARKATGGALKPPVKEAWLEDLNPPPTFLVSLDAPADGFSNDEAAFFGKGGVAQPDLLFAPLPRQLSSAEDNTGLLLERRLHLGPGESRTLYFAYGYLPQGIELNPLLDKFRNDLPGLWQRSSAAWKPDRISLAVPEEPWVDRELAWHYYYLRSNLTYDSFYQEHILSQGHVYQYLIGFQGAARDPLQHALPLIYSCPEIVKEVLRYTLKEVLPDGEIPYGVTGHGMRMAVPFRPSDQEIWLLWLASEYVLATRDTDFLNEVIPTFPLYGKKAGRESVQNLLIRCYRHLTQVTGKGRHGLMRLSNGDWNDGAVVGFVPKDQHEDVRLNGESTLNAAFATYTLDLYARMLTFVGNNGLAAEVHNWAEGQRKAVREQWGGKWFRRGWLNEKLGWIGENEMWLEPQPWAIIGGAATPQQTEKLVENIDKLMRKPSPIGAMLMSQSLKQIETAPGDLTNAAVWPSINGTLVWALALVDGKLAWDEWKKNSLAYHAEAYPDIWYGIWSGPDTYNSVLSKYPGQTFFDEKALLGDESKSPLGSGVNWTDFPVMNMHPHAWPLYDTTKLIGAEFMPEGLRLSPVLTQNKYRFVSPLLGLEKSQTEYSGWYAPLKAGTWQIILRLPEKERDRFTQMEVNGHVQPLQFSANGYIQFIGDSAPGQPLRWSLS